jgi:hypothetical protein
MSYSCENDEEIIPQQGKHCATTEFLTAENDPLIVIHQQASPPSPSSSP